MLKIGQMVQKPYVRLTIFGQNFLSGLFWKSADNVFFLAENPSYLTLKFWKCIKYSANHPFKLKIGQNVANIVL